MRMMRCGRDGEDDESQRLIVKGAFYTPGIERD